MRRKREKRFQRIVVTLTLIAVFVTLTAIITKKEAPQVFSFFESNAERLWNNDKEDENWMLLLVNSENPLNEEYEFTQMTLVDGDIIDVRIYEDLQEMFDEAQDNGIFPHINSAYRTRERQQELLDERIAAYIDEGHSAAEAEELARDYVMLPGTSEHETGLALDLTATEGTGTIEDFQKWMMVNSYKFGFILRYPANKVDITGIDYEPWHYRYVGRENALFIYENNLCLEEFLDSYPQGVHNAVG